jgi:hypothetical protein
VKEQCSFQIKDGLNQLNKKSGQSIVTAIAALKSSTMANLNQTIETPKLRIKANITETIQIDMEVDSPYYCKYSDNHLFKLKENDLVISVKVYNHVTAIELESTQVWAKVLPQCQKCTEEEFNNAYKTALTKIQNQSL